MNDTPLHRRFGRRSLMLGGLGLAGAVVAGEFLTSGPPAPELVERVASVRTDVPGKTLRLAGTDGWVSIADPAHTPSIGGFWPDPLAPAPRNLYVFGFRDVTGLTDAQVKAQRGRAQISAPLMWFDQDTQNRVTLTNLGLSQRPDLVDGHTIHFHGFQNAIPLFDGVPELSISVPIGRDFTYFYWPHDPGTYMYHCHFEDVEHVQMGMTGLVFVRPTQNNGSLGQPAGKYAYNDGDGSTRYDREFAIILTEIWAEAHYRDAHIQVTDWTDYHPSFWAMNGRTYPDTTLPGSGYDATGAPTGANARLQYQPNSSLITCNAGEKVLIRLASLGYQNHSMTVDGIDLTIVGKDAGLLKDKAGLQHYITTNTVELGPGESRDVIFTAPSRPGTYLLYDRSYADLNNAGGGGFGGQMTEIRVSPAGTLAPQTVPNA